MVVTLADKPGSLGNVPSKLGVAGINIDCAYTSRAKEKGKVNTYVAVVDVNTALKALRTPVVVGGETNTGSTASRCSNCSVGKL